MQSRASTSINTQIGSRLLAVCLAMVAFMGAADASAATLAITHVSIVDATGTPPQADMTAVVKDGRIVELGKSDAVHAPADAVTVNGSGKYLIPGLWDMHVHEVFGDWLPRNEKVVLPLFVANGITGVREHGRRSGRAQGVARADRGRQLLGPRMIIAGPMLDGPIPRFPSSAPVANAADGRKGGR